MANHGDYYGECGPKVQYVHGPVVAGAGIYLEASSCAGGTAIIYDIDTVDSLTVIALPGALIQHGWSRD